MLTYKKGTCAECGAEDTYLVKKTQRGRLCVTCNRDRLMKQNVLHERKSTGGTGEAVLFRSIWAVRPHRCEGCGEHLGEEAKAHNFSHTIRKSRRKDLRLVDANIRLKCYDCHRVWDFGTKEEKQKQDCWESELEYIRSEDPALYQSLIG